MGFIFLLFFIFHIWVMVWGYNDAEKRGKSGCLVLLLFLFLAFPLNIILWLIIRPENNY